MVGLRGGPRIYFSNYFPSETDASTLGTTLETCDFAHEELLGV